MMGGEEVTTEKSARKARVPMACHEFMSRWVRNLGASVIAPPPDTAVDLTSDLMCVGTRARYVRELSAPPSGRSARDRIGATETNRSPSRAAAHVHAFSLSCAAVAARSPLTCRRVAFKRRTHAKRSSQNWRAPKLPPGWTLRRLSTIPIPLLQNRRERSTSSW